MRTRPALALFVGLVLAAPGLRAQQPGTMPPGMTGHGMMMGQDVLAKLDSMDTRLDRLVNEMNSAGKNKKLDAMAAVINELVAQRHAMGAWMAGHLKSMMESGMMGGMMTGPGVMNGKMMPGPGMGQQPRTAPDSTPASPDSADHAKHHPEQ